MSMPSLWCLIIYLEVIEKSPKIHWEFTVILQETKTPIFQQNFTSVDFLRIPVFTEVDIWLTFVATTTVM
jgi:hypothetical protein